MPNKINLDEKEIIRMYENGMTFLFIAQKLNVSKYVVRDRLRKNGIYLSPGRKKTIFDSNRVLELYNEGNSLDAVALEMNLSRDTVRNFLLNLNVIRKTGPKRTITINDNFFSNPTKENCYWAGFIAADGNVQGNNLIIQLKDVDFEHLEKFRNCVGLSSIVRIRNNGKNKSGKIKKSCVLRFRSNQIIDNLNNIFNIIPNKSLVLEPPNIFNEDLVRAYIRGYFDGDGCISKSKGLNFEVYSGSKNILEWIKQQIKNYLNVGSPLVKRKTKNTYRISFSGNKQVVIIMNWLYENCDNNFLYRKKIKFTNFIGGLK